MVIKLISIMLFFSIYFSYSINHSIENNNLNFIDNHVIISKSNGTILKNHLVFDIYPFNGCNGTCSCSTSLNINR